jgi:hypothetical protein
VFVSVENAGLVPRLAFFCILEEEFPQKRKISSSWVLNSSDTMETEQWGQSGATVFF